MSDLIRETVPVEARPAFRRWRPMSIVAALALVLACVLVSPTAQAAPTPKVATSSVSASSAAAGAAQLDFRSIVCPILDVLATGPFAAFIAPFIGPLRVAFGCVSA